MSSRRWRSRNPAWGSGSCSGDCVGRATVESQTGLPSLLPSGFEPATAKEETISPARPLAVIRSDSAELGLVGRFYERRPVERLTISHI